MIEFVTRNVGWILFGVSLVGTLLNARKVKEGFLVWIAANIAWVVYLALHNGDRALQVQFAVYAWFAIYGYFQWSAKEDPRGEVFFNWKLPGGGRVVVKARTLSEARETALLLFKDREMKAEELSVVWTDIPDIVLPRQIGEHYEEQVREVERRLKVRLAEKTEALRRSVENLKF